MEPRTELAWASEPLSGSVQRLAVRLDVDADARFAAEQTMRIVFPDRADDPRFREAILRSSVDKIDAMWRVIGGRDPLPHTAPVAAFAFAETAAASGMPVSQFERAYRVGIGLVWLCWYRHALEHAARSRQAVAELIGPPTMVIHAYVDGVLTPLVDRFVATRSEQEGPREHLRRNILRGLLSGSAPLDASAAEAALGIALDGEHVALVLPVDADQLCAEVLGRAQRACGASSVLVHRHGPDAHVVWLSAPGGFAAGGLVGLRDMLERTGLRIALGVPDTGLEGLSATARGALDAARLQRQIGPGAETVVSFADVRLEALLLAEPERARRFVRDELGALDSTDVAMRRLRDTAMSWLQTGSHVGTAAGLGIHEHTVRRRIAQAEELLGGPLAERRTELLVALRLKRVMDGSREHPGAALTDSANR